MAQTGAMIALASDFRFATPTARTAFLFVRVGLAGCDMGACALLPRLIGQGRVPAAAGLIIAVLLESGWELWENSNHLIDRYNKAGVVYAGDSIINSVGDLLVMMLGFLIAATAPAWVSVLILFGTEVGLALLIRDNLLLNIINLIRPIEWISKWQELR